MGKLQQKKLSDFLNNSCDIPESYRKQSNFKRKDNSDGGQLFDFLKLVKSWEKIVGNNAGTHSMPVKFTHGTLSIICSHPAWSKELSLLEQDLRIKIKNNFPLIATSLKNIKFFTGPGELQRLRETLLKSGDNSPVAKENFQKQHPHSPHYKKMRIMAENVLESANQSEILEQEVKELLISLIIQLHQS